MKDESMKKQNFLQGAAILAAATLIVKLLGFLFKTPLNYIIGETGSSYFYNAYRVYDVLLMISTTGLPVAMSRMISEAQTLGNHAQIRKIYKTALYVFLTIGIVGSLGMFLFSKPLSVLVSNSETSWAAIAALAPCVLIICMISAYRGFFQGQSNMAPTSISQIFEAIIRLVIGLSLAWLLMRETGSATYAAAGGILGVTVGSFVSMAYLHGKFRQSSKILQEAGGTAKSTRATMKELLAIAIPITLGAAGLQIINLVDASIYMRRLSGALGYTATQVDTLNGIYTFQQTIFALPCSFITTITISCIPAITAALTRKDDAEAKGTEESAIRTMALIALPCAIGLAVMAEPIIRLLCPGYSETSVAVATPILQVFGIAVICNSMVLLLNAIMQAHGDVTTPVVNMLIGGVVKVIVNYFLVAVPSLNIVGAAIGTLTCYAVITALDLVAIRRRISTKPRVLRNMLRPALAAVLMGAVTFGAYRLAGRILSPKLACLLALVIAVVCYAVLVVLLRCITYQDCLLLPKGEKIAKLLHLREKT